MDFHPAETAVLSFITRLVCYVAKLLVMLLLLNAIRIPMQRQAYAPHPATPEERLAALAEFRAIYDTTLEPASCHNPWAGLLMLDIPVELTRSLPAPPAGELQVRQELICARETERRLLWRQQHAALCHAAQVEGGAYGCAEFQRGTWYEYTTVLDTARESADYRRLGRMLLSQGLALREVDFVPAAPPYGHGRARFEAYAPSADYAPTGTLVRTINRFLPDSLRLPNTLAAGNLLYLPNVLTPLSIETTQNTLGAPVLIFHCHSLVSPAVSEAMCRRMERLYRAQE